MKRLLSLLCLLGIMVAFQAKLLADPPLYMVVYDLDKTEWKVRYTNDDPDLTNDACRTTELWLRYIPAGKFWMGSPTDELGRYDNEVLHRVTLTQPFYIGVFECTQKQWEMVMGGRPDCYFKNDAYYATRPVEQVAYDDIRGSKSVADWPTDNVIMVGDTSFMGILRAKTGLTFDLPTEAQWEYACRAGTTKALNSDENLRDKYEDTAMGAVGRYWYNGGEKGNGSRDCDTTYGTAKVGSYLPNNWGLYDMHGNVFEWCLDWWDGTPYDASAVEDPKGDITAWDRVVRGGSWDNNAYYCRSAFRDSISPSSSGSIFGFRVLCLMPETFPEACSVTVVNGTANKATAYVGETVTITAAEPTDDEEFDKWTSDDGVEFENANDMQTSFVMPAAAVTVTATYKAKTVAPLYMVVYDLDKTEWKVRYTNDGPDLTDDTCRTTELWLRYIPAGKFTMGSPTGELGRWDDEVQHEVTITQPFYIGVFECTQKQWELVKGNNPSSNKGDCRPVEQVSYDDIRGTGAEAGAGWPKYGHAVDETSFMGILRAGTGLTFDLPTEAQWEYACRAGTTKALNSDENLENEYEDTFMAEVGRYNYNQSDDNGGYKSYHTTVGSYRPNNWGLYDMHGNVYEWCLDWWDGESPYDASSVEDPKGDETGSYRVFRGGCWTVSASNCRSAFRNYYPPIYTFYSVGFRVLCLMPETYEVTVVNGTADKAEAYVGETVTITAGKPADDEEFDKWTSDDGVEFENANDVQTSFTMPAAAVTVTATYKAKATATYAVTVVNGTSDKAEAAEGDTITITADMPAAGKTFDKWTGSGVTFENAAAPVTTFEMPAKAVTVKATFKKLPSVKTYKITVVNGAADKAKAAAGETVTITANAAPAGKVFDKWTGGAAFEDATSPTTMFVMPAKAVTPKALYKRK